MVGPRDRIDLELRTLLQAIHDHLDPGQPQLERRAIEVRAVLGIILAHDQRLAARLSFYAQLLRGKAGR
jgi:hypothetical protein